MNEDLFEIPAYKLVRRNDPSTSYEAAESIDPTKMQQIVLDAIKSIGPCIHDEVWKYVQITHPNITSNSSVSSRFNELEKKGLIELTGEKRKGRSNRKQRDWRAICSH